MKIRVIEIKELRPRLHGASMGQYVELNVEMSDDNLRRFLREVREYHGDEFLLKHLNEDLDPEDYNALLTKALNESSHE